MSHNDSLCEVSSPQMTQNDSLFQASMPQMSQNDSHFEVFSFEMTQNDSFSGLSCPTEHPLSVADEPPATPPSPQNDTPSKTLPAPKAITALSAPALLEQGHRPRAIALGYLDDAIPFPLRWFGRPAILPTCRTTAPSAQAGIQGHQVAGWRRDSTT